MLLSQGSHIETHWYRADSITFGVTQTRVHILFRQRPLNQWPVCPWIMTIWITILNLHRFGFFVLLFEILR